MPYQTSPVSGRRGRGVACRDCRQKKLKCDLEYPVCGRCSKKTTLPHCVYDHGTPSRPLKSKKTPRSIRGVDSASAHSDSTEPRIMVSTVRSLRDGQSVMKFKQIGSGSVQQSNSDRSETHGDRDIWHSTRRVCMKTVVKEDVIRYRGNGIVANLLFDLPDVKSLMGELRASSGILNRMSNDINKIKIKIHKSRLESPEAVPSVAVLLALLPSREVVTELVELYLQYIEITHRIVHIPSFKRELNEFWTSKEATAPFIVQLLLIISCATVLFEADQIRRTEPTSTIPHRFPAIDWIHFSERWMDTSGPKWPNLTMLRIHCLLIVAKNSQCLNQNREWLATGNLVRLATLAGYHCDPSYIGNLDPFTAEMRKRIWVTILELDVQAAFDQGLRPCLEPSSFDAIVLLNVNDDELHENMQEPPISKPFSDITDSSFQTILAKSLPLRLTICAEMHSPTLSCSYEDVLRYELKLKDTAIRFPEWERHTSEDGIGPMIFDLWTSILETKLCQALIALHTPFAIGAATNQIFGQSSRTQLEASMAILSRQCRLHKMSMKLSFCHLSHAIFQAALSVLHYLFNTNATTSNSPLLSHGPPIFAHSLTLVEEILECLESKLLPVIKGIKQYFLLNIILIVVKVKLWPNHKETIKNSAAEKLGSTVYAIVAYNANDMERSQAVVAQTTASPMELHPVQATYLDGIENAFLNDSNLSDAVTETSSFWHDLLDWNGSLSLPP